MALRAPFRTLTIYCRCGQKLLRYRKRGKGRLVKIHRLRVAEDYVGLFTDDTLPEGTDICCPQCQARLATVRKVSGKWVYKLNQGQLGLIRR